MDVIGELIDKKKQAEWDFMSRLLLEGDSSVKECWGLPPSIFSVEELGILWESVKKGKRLQDAALELNVELLLKLTNNSSNLLLTWAKDYEKLIWKYHYCIDAVVMAQKVAKFAIEANVNKIYEEISYASKIVPYETSKALSIEEIAQAYVDNKHGDDIMYGFPRLHDIIGNLRRGTLTFVAGRPGMGKTSFVLQMAKNIARSKKYVRFYSLEMDKTLLLERMIASHCEISISDVRHKDAEFILSVSNGLNDIYGRYLTIVDDAYTPEDIIRDSASANPDVIIIDHVDEMRKPSYSKENTWRSQYMKEIRDFGKKYEIAVVAALQLNRETEDRVDKRPLLADIRWDGGLEQVADIVLMGYADEYYDNLAKATTIPFELWVRKNRSGEKNKCVKMLYNLVTQTFNDDVSVTTVKLDELL